MNLNVTEYNILTSVLTFILFYITLGITNNGYLTPAQRDEVHYFHVEKIMKNGSKMLLENHFRN